MEVITVGFSTHRKFNLFSWAIRAVDKTPFSHVYCVFHSDSLDRDLLYHAARTFLHFLSLPNFEKDNITYYTFSIKITLEQKKKLLQLCIDKAGISYGIKAVSGVALVKLFKLININIKSPFEDGNKTYFCSELVSFLLSELDLKVVNTDPENDSVKWLFEMLKSETYKNADISMFTK